MSSSLAASEPRLCFASCRVRLAFWEWGSSDSDHGALQFIALFAQLFALAHLVSSDSLHSAVVVCVHGLTRQGRDFDALARALLARRPHLRIVCPDIVGRGHSEWLPSEQALTGYAVPQYTLDMLVLLRELNTRAPIRTLDWVGM
jgi:pimeloyl-ACP methyl ester carboxylesterase